MTVLMREEMNDADIAWAAADACVGRVAHELLQARQSLNDEREARSAVFGQSEIIPPAVLRARGAL